MSQTKYYLPPDIKRTAIEMIRGYDRRLACYNEARYNIINGSSCDFVTYTVTRRKKDGTIKREQCRQYFQHGSTISNPTADKFARLDALENHVETIRMRAVEQAKISIGIDIIDENQRQKLISAIWDSCIDGRNFVFQYYNLCVSKSNFYERRAEFLTKIAQKTQFL